MARPTNVEKKVSNSDKKISSKFPGSEVGKAQKRKSKAKRRPGSRPKWEKQVAPPGPVPAPLAVPAYLSHFCLRSAMRQIKQVASSTTPSIPRAAYKRIFKWAPPCVPGHSPPSGALTVLSHREIGNESSLNGGVRWNSSAVNVLIAASEAMVGNLFEKAATLTDLRAKKTISLGDLKSVRTLESMGNH